MRFLPAVAAIALATLVGCGKKSNVPEIKPVSGVKVSGKMVQGTGPVKYLKDETIKVTFISESGTGADKIVAQAEVNKDAGTFAINGPTGQGIPAGKYKVVIASEVYPPAGDVADRFADKFDAEKSTLVAEVTAEEGQVFTVDVGGRKVTKGK